MMKRLLPTLFLFQLFFLVDAHGQPSTILLTNPVEGTQWVNEPIFYLQDSSMTLSLEEVQSPSMQSSFNLSPLDDVAVAQEPSVFWLSFTLKNLASEKQECYLDFEEWLYVDFYSADSTEVRHQRTGNFVPYKERDSPKSNRNLIRIQLDPGEEQDCWVRLETNRRSNLMPATLQFKATSLERVREWELNMRSIVMFFTGIFIVMFLFNIFVYISTKDHDYFYYLILIAVFIIAPASNYGYSLELLKESPNFVFAHPYVMTLGSSTLNVTLLLFTISFFNLKERHPIWRRIGLGLVAATFLVAIPLFMRDIVSADGLLGLCILTSVIFEIIIAIKGLISKYPSSTFYLLALAVFLLSGFFEAALNLQVLPTDEIANLVGPASAVVLVVFLSIALANKVNVLTEENEQKQLEIINQLEENEKLQTKVNRELEEKVEERTQDLKVANSDLKHTLDLVEEERKKSDSLLLSILPKATAEELKARGKAAPQSYSMASVLFADFIDFTQLAEQMSPEEVVRNLNTCIEAFDQIVEKYNVEKIKTMGDAYICAGGIPVANATNPLDAVKAGLEMQSFMKDWNARRLEQGLLQWNLRLGVNTGELVAGVIGKKKFAYDIWGDAVNIAARMEQNCEPGKVNVSEETYRHIKDHFKCTFRGKVHAKNKGEINMYYVEEAV